MGPAVAAKRQAIEAAILSRNLLQVRGRGLTRIVEPYLLYESKAGALILHSWQVAGEFEESCPPDWCDLRLDEIYAVTVLDKRYERPHPDYNPNSKRFHRVIVYTPK